MSKSGRPKAPCCLGIEPLEERWLLSSTSLPLLTGLLKPTTPVVRVVNESPAPTKLVNAGPSSAEVFDKPINVLPSPGTHAEATPVPPAVLADESAPSTSTAPALFLSPLERVEAPRKLEASVAIGTTETAQPSVPFSGVQISKLDLVSFPSANPVAVEGPLLPFVAFERALDTEFVSSDTIPVDTKLTPVASNEAPTRVTGSVWIANARLTSLKEFHVSGFLRVVRLGDIRITLPKGSATPPGPDLTRIQGPLEAETSGEPGTSAADDGSVPTLPEPGHLEGNHGETRRESAPPRPTGAEPGRKAEAVSTSNQALPLPLRSLSGRSEQVSSWSAGKEVSTPRRADGGLGLVLPASQLADSGAVACLTTSSSGMGTITWTDASLRSSTGELDVSPATAKRDNNATPRELLLVEVVTTLGELETVALDEPDLRPQAASLLTAGVSVSFSALEHAVLALTQPLAADGAASHNQLYWLGFSSWLLAAAVTGIRARRNLLPLRAVHPHLVSHTPKGQR